MIRTLLLILIGLFAAIKPAGAVLELDITQGNIQPFPIAIPDFAGDGSIDPQVAREISKVVANDLRASGLFIPIDQAAFIERGVNMDQVPNFQDWRVVNAQALVVGRIGSGDGRLVAEFRLWDVFSGQQLTGEQVFARPKDARRIGHIIADTIYERITGEKGYFDPCRVRRRIGAQGPAHEAARHHGSGWPQCASPDYGQRACADASLQPIDAGDHLHVVRGRDP